jgi:hypothetical protein
MSKSYSCQRYLEGCQLNILQTVVSSRRAEARKGEGGRSTSTTVLALFEKEMVKPHG